MGVILLIVVFLIASCAPPVKTVRYGDTLSAPCPESVVLRVSYCPTRHAYSDRIQHLSRVRVISLETGKSVTLSVRMNKRVKGFCVPKRFRRLMGGGESVMARVEVLRCGENGVRKCPKRLRGYASWYGAKFHGRKTASGTRFNMHAYVAAHRTLPLGTVLIVRNLKNGKTVKVKVLDRGPYVKGRHLDLSYAAAKKLDMLNDGVIPFVAEVVRCGG